MSLALKSLPQHLQTQVIAKADCDSFVKLLKSNHGMMQLCLEAKNKRLLKAQTLALHLEIGINGRIDKVRMVYGKNHMEDYINDFIDLPFRFDVAVLEVKTLFLSQSHSDANFTESQAVDLIQFFKRTHSTASLLKFHQPKITSSSESFAHLLEIAKVRQLMVNDISPDLIDMPAFGQLQRLFLTAELDDFQLLDLKGSFIRICDSRVTAFGLRTYIQQWLRGLRPIGTLLIHTTAVVFLPEVLAILPPFLFEERWVGGETQTVYRTVYNSQFLTITIDALNQNFMIKCKILKGEESQEALDFYSKREEAMTYDEWFSGEGFME